MFMIPRNLYFARRVGVTVTNLKFSECASAKNVIKSKFHDVVIPNLKLHQFVWERNLDRWPQRTAIICGLTGRGYTYEQAFTLSTIFAAALRTKFKLKDGDCIAIILPNSPDFPIALFGANEAGCVVTTINPAYSPDEIARQVKESNGKLVVTFAAKVDDVRKSFEIGKINIPIIVTKTPEECLPKGTASFSEIVEDKSIDKSCLKSVKTDSNDLAFLPYSSGTTGLPKGVELTNRNLVANMTQENEKDILYVDPDSENQYTLMAVLPFFHIYAINTVLCHKMSLGMRLVTLPAFSLPNLLEGFLKYKANGLHAVPPIVSALALHPLSKREHYQHLECIFSGAAPLIKTDCNKLYEKVNKSGFMIRQGYGLTETSPVISTQTPDDTNLECSGELLPNTYIRIVGESGENLGAYKLGEIQVRGPQVMRGYRNNPVATRDSFAEAGWLRTGDSGKYDETGRLYVAERIKELIKVKGYQVAPAELENVIKEHPKVLDAAVVGVPDPKTGESPRAFVVIRKNESCQPHDVMSFVAGKVAPFKKLSNVTFVDEIPRSASGKVLKKVIKEQYC